MPRKKNKRKNQSAVSKVDLIAVKNKIARSSLIFLKGHKCLLVDKVTGEIFKPEYKTSMAIAQLEYNWAVTAYVFGKDKADNYFKSSEISVNKPCKTSDISDVVAEEYDNIAKNFNNNHYMNVGWIADPKGEFHSDEFAYTVFEKMGAWLDVIPQGAVTET